MLRVEEALDRILETVHPTIIERVSLGDVLGRVFAEDIQSRREHPPWDNSAMDGYAIRWEDIRTTTESKPTRLAVVGEVQAGKMPDRSVAAGEAIQIMTGAPIPSGADCVVRIEDTRREEDHVTILQACLKGENIRSRGEDVHAGEKVIARGSWGRPAEVGMLATAGLTSALVYRRPVVSVLATGDELCEPGAVPRAEQILNSNSYSIGAQVRESGGTPLILEVARDDRDDLEAKVRQALTADICLVVGGVSKGKYDYVRDVLLSLGCEMKFWQVAMRPGHPLAFGVFPREIGTIPGYRLFFGLPGNPVSSMVTFYQFVRPALRKMMGANSLHLPTGTAILMEDLDTRPGRRQFVRAVTTFEEGRNQVRQTGDQGSGILLSMVRANSLIVLPEDRGVFKKGEPVQIQWLPSSE